MILLLALKFISGEVWIFINIDQFLPFGKAV